MTALEEEEEVGRSWDHTIKKGAHTYQPYVISCPWAFGGVVHNPPRVVHMFRWDELCVVVRPQTPKIGCLIPIGSYQRLRYYGSLASSWSWCWRVCTPDFYRVYQTILHSSTNLDRNPGGSKDHPRISPSTDYYMSLEN